MTNPTDTPTAPLSTVALDDLLAQCETVMEMEVPGVGTVTKTAPEVFLSTFQVRINASGINPRLADEATQREIQKIVHDVISQVEATIGRPLDRVETHASWRISAEAQ